MNPINDETIAEMARRVVQAVDPDMVLLFGSRARGDARADSDVDLLVIGRSEVPRHLRSLHLYRALRGMGVPKDVLWVTPEEVAEWSGVKNHVINRGLKEGRVLYDRQAA